MLSKFTIYVVCSKYGKNMHEALESIFWRGVMQHSGLPQGRVAHAEMKRHKSLQAKHPADRARVEAVLLSPSTTAPSNCEFLRDVVLSQPVG